MIKTTGPMEADRVLEAFAQSGDEAVGKALIEALKAPGARGGITTSQGPRVPHRASYTTVRLGLGLTVR